MANLSTEFHEHLTRPGVQNDQEMIQISDFINWHYLQTYFTMHTITKNSLIKIN